MTSPQLSAEQTSPVAESAAAARADTLAAIRNGLKLGASLVLTWGIALVVRLLLPRTLGPDRFGALNFADSFTGAFFVLLGLGLDTYVRMEIPVRPAHASDFFGSLTVARLMLAGALVGVMTTVLAAGHRPGEMYLLVFLYAAAQLCTSNSNTLQAMLHSRGRVSGVSVLAVVTKVIWAVGVFLALFTHAGLWALAAAYLAGEAIDVGVLYWLARVHVKLRFRVDLRAGWAVLIASLPFFLNGFAVNIYNQLDGALLGMLTLDREVGFYGAANGLANLTMMMTPLIGWVLMPLFVRARARSEGEYEETMRRALEYILVAAIPLSLAFSLGADVWIGLIYGEAFAPAVLSLRLLAPMAALTYVAVVSSYALNLAGKGWTLTAISVGGLVLNVLLNLLLIRGLEHWLGAGGGGAACSLAQLGTEVAVTAAQLWFMGKRFFDRRMIEMLLKTGVVCALVAVADRSLAFLGPTRLLADLALYLGLVLALRAAPIAEMVAFVRESIRGRREDVSPG